MVETENKIDDIHCYCEKQDQKIIYIVHDKSGNFATSPNSHREAAIHLKTRQSK